MAVPSPDTDLYKQKQAIRRDMRDRRRSFVTSLEPAVRAALEEQLAELLAPMIASARIIGAYSPVGGEISPMPALARARRLGKTVAFPTFGEDDRDPFTFRAGEPAMPGPHRIPQPCQTCPQVTPDLVLVPLVAIGNDGVRIGQGKGHFDRVLPDLPDARMIGIGWKMQRLDRDLPHDDHDVALHAFACPRGVEEF